MTGLLQEPADPRGRGERKAACAHCRRRLGAEYFFTCRRCGRSYCYIHMSRHPAASCRGAPIEPRSVAVVLLVREGSPGSSANV